MSGSEPFGRNSRVADPRPLPQAVVTTQTAVFDLERQEQVATILPEVEMGSYTILPMATFLDESMDNQETGMSFTAEAIYPKGQQVLEDDLTDLTIYFMGLPASGMILPPVASFRRPGSKPWPEWRMATG